MLGVLAGLGESQECSWSAGAPENSPPKLGEPLFRGDPPSHEAPEPTGRVSALGAHTLYPVLASLVDHPRRDPRVQQLLRVDDSAHADTALVACP